MMRPNILYIHSHDTGRYVQPYGYKVSTPNIQRLADEGILFRQAFCAAPTCSPSRASLLTGRSAHSSGMIGLAHRGFSLSDYHQHLVHTLRTAGYSSTLIGVQHEARDPQIIGYDRIVQLPDNHAAHVAPAAVDLLNHARSEPFFASVGFFETHREFPEPEPAEDARYVCPPPSLPDAPETRRDVAAFMTGARQLDRGVGLVLRALQRSGLAQNTLVICTTDHGMAFPGIKCNLKDAGIGVMLIMRGPGGFSGGRVCDAMVSQIDIFPTLCDLLGIDPPPWLEGHSLLPWISGQRQEIRDELFAEVTYHAAYEPQRALRTRRWKYIRRYGGKQTPVLPNCDDSPSKELWLQLGWREQVLPQEQFYDLAFDPNETHNLAYDPSQQTTLEDMRYRLDRWMRETSDPLLRGPVPAPSGAQVNDPEGLSPREPTLTVP
jgi:N-sulfoglucosamine sulfohydrolase